MMSSSSRPLLLRKNKLEKQSLNANKNVKTRKILIPGIGLRFINGISQSYDDVHYPPELSNIITETDYFRTIKRVNQGILSFWPCTTCYLFGYACAPFTLGLSLCCPSYCHSLAEKKLNDDLYDISLNSRYYDRNINFSLYKKWFQSYIVIEIPETLFSKDYISSDGDDIEGGSNSSVNSTSNISSVVDLNMSSIDNSDTKTE